LLHGSGRRRSADILRPSVMLCAHLPIDKGGIMSPFALHGRVALITGGNGGIGLGMAHGLAAAGAAIAIAGRDAAKSARAVAELARHEVKTTAIAVDVCDENSCRAMVEATVTELGRLDILVNNAGINIRKQPQDYTFPEWRQVIDTN